MSEGAAPGSRGDDDLRTQVAGLSDEQLLAHLASSGGRLRHLVAREIGDRAEGIAAELAADLGEVPRQKATRHVRNVYTRRAKAGDLPGTACSLRSDITRVALAEIRNLAERPRLDLPAREDDVFFSSRRMPRPEWVAYAAEVRSIRRTFLAQARRVAAELDRQNPGMNYEAIFRAWARLAARDEQSLTIGEVVTELREHFDLGLSEEIADQLLSEVLAAIRQRLVPRPLPEAAALQDLPDEPGG